MKIGDPVSFWPVLIMMILATVFDLRSRRIPDLVTAPFLAGGLVVSLARYGWQGLGQSLLGVLLASLILGIFCYLGGMGLGDLKLCAAAGAWVGPSQLGTALIMTGLAGGVIAIVWSAASGVLWRTLRDTGSLISGFLRTGRRRGERPTLHSPLAFSIPYAPAIAIGTLWSFLSR